MFNSGDHRVDRIEREAFLAGIDAVLYVLIAITGLAIITVQILEKGL